MWTQGCDEKQGSVRGVKRQLRAERKKGEDMTIQG